MVRSAFWCSERLILETTMETSGNSSMVVAYVTMAVAKEHKVSRTAVPTAFRPHVWSIEGGQESVPSPLA